MPQCDVGRDERCAERLAETGGGAAVARRHGEQVTLRVAAETAVGVGIGEVEFVEFAVAVRLADFAAGFDAQVGRAFVCGGEGRQRRAERPCGEFLRDGDAYACYDVFHNYSPIVMIRVQYSSELSRWAITTSVSPSSRAASSAIERLISSSVRLSSAEVASSKKSTSARR